MKKSVLALAALATALVSVPALAAPISTSVRTADLNLSSPAGRETLSRRISTAAKRVCNVSGDPSLVSIMAGNRCYDRAVNAAQNQIASVGHGIALASS